MASDLQKKSQQIMEDGKLPHTGQTPGSPQVNPNRPTFTPEQRQSLGNVYLLILSWRREGKMKPVSSIPLTSSIGVSPAEREA